MYISLFDFYVFDGIFPMLILWIENELFVGKNQSIHNPKFAHGCWIKIDIFAIGLALENKGT